MGNEQSLTGGDEDRIDPKVQRAGWVEGHPDFEAVQQALEGAKPHPYEPPVMPAAEFYESDDEEDYFTGGANPQEGKSRFAVMAEDYGSDDEEEAFAAAGGAAARQAGGGNIAHDPYFNMDAPQNKMFAFGTIDREMSRQHGDNIHGQVIAVMPRNAVFGTQGFEDFAERVVDAVDADIEDAMEEEEVEFVGLTSLPVGAVLREMKRIPAGRRVIVDELDF